MDVGPLLFAARSSSAEALYWQYDKAIGDTTPVWTVAIRRGDYKLLADAALEKFALYDLKADVGEKTDLSGDPRQAERLTAMTSELEGDVGGREREAVTSTSFHAARVT